MAPTVLPIRHRYCPGNLPMSPTPPCPRRKRTTSPEALMYQYAGRPLARWTISGGGQVANDTKPG
jgi:hypothetical protein